MQAALRLAQVQKQSGRDFVIVDRASSSSWTVQTARAMRKENTANRVIFDSYCDHVPRLRHLTLTISVVLSDRPQQCVKRRTTMLPE